MKKEKAIKSSAVEIINYYIGSATILDLEVHNKWLRATLSSGIKFSIRNL